VTRLVRLRGWRPGRNVADRLITSPLVRWTWLGLNQESYNPGLTDYRPIDRDTVREMMDGRYLLASKLVDSGGASPFALHIDHPDWRDELHSFSWLRHFSDARDQGERAFARTLVLDWIGRFGEYDAHAWGLTLTAQRVINWLRHYSLVTEGAGAEQVRTIARSLSMQVQSVKQRGSLAADPFDELMAAMVPVAVTLSDGSEENAIAAATAHLTALLGAHLDKTGMFGSRNPAQQLALLTELITLRQALSQRSTELVQDLGPQMDRMHLALASVVLSTGEPGYFNGCGQQPAEIMFAVQSQGATRRNGNALVAGYGIVSQGPSVVMLDSGRVPAPAFAGNAHSSALAFEFSHGRDLVVANCGPAPAELIRNKDLFRMGAAHSGPTVEGESAGRIGRAGTLSGYGDKPYIEVDRTEPTMFARTSAFRSRFGVQIERRVTLMSGGDTLVGQDKLLVPGGRRNLKGMVTLRFHLAPGARAERAADGEMIRIVLASGAEWSFLWEAATAAIEDSVRQSAHIGFHHTRQIVLEAAVAPNAEIAWILTRQDG